MPIEYITMKEAREYLGISRTKLWQLVKEGTISTFSDKLDKRRRLVIKADLASLRVPKPQQ